LRRKGSFLPFLLAVLPLAALFAGGRLPVPPDRGRGLPICLDLNEAPAFRLSLLPGLGPARSARIVEERERAGPFRDLEDLVRRVDGLGPGLAEKLVPFLKNPPPPEAGGR